MVMIIFFNFIVTLKYPNSNSDFDSITASQIEVEMEED